MQTSPVSTRPRKVTSVGVDELRAAWKAIEAGQFGPSAKPAANQIDKPTPRVTGPAQGPSKGWVPGAKESVIAVLGALGSAGTTTVALSMATAAGSGVRLVESCSASASGLIAAASAELGDQGAWRRGRRDGVLLLWRRNNDLAPVPGPTEAGLTVVDLGSGPLSGWPASALAEAPALVLVTRATVPGLRRLERELERHTLSNLALAVVGPPLKRWPKVLTLGLGDRTQELVGDGRLVCVPVDRTLAITGLTPELLPPALVSAGGRLHALLGKEPS